MDDMDEGFDGCSAWIDGPGEREARLARAKDVSLEDAAHMLWAVIANVSGGDWHKQSKEWQEAAIRYRDEYFKCIE